MDSSGIPAGISRVTVLFTGDAEIQNLNHTFRRKNKPTDVLSFSSIEGRKVPTFETELGALVISLDTAAGQARRYRVPISQEIARLLVHGTLHLLGFDHEKVPKSRAQQMRRTERALLKALIQADLVAGLVEKGR